MKHFNQFITEREDADKNRYKSWDSKKLADLAKEFISVIHNKTKPSDYKEIDWSIAAELDRLRPIMQELWFRQFNDKLN